MNVRRDGDVFAPIDLAPWQPPRASSGFVVDLVGGAEPVIRLAGELDLAAVGTFEVAAFRLLEKGARCIVLDLGALDFVDVSGINALLGLARAARQAGADLVLRRPRPQAVDLLERTRAREVLTVE